MKTAIFGYAGSGKTDLFAALAGENAVGQGRGMVKVPEPRLEPLTKLFNSKKTIPAEIEFLDLPGGGGKGSGLGDRILSQARQYDCFLVVLDAFSGMNDANEQYESIEADFIITDLAVVEKRLERIGLEKKKNKNLVDEKEEELLIKVKEVLESERPLREEPELSETPELRGFQFLSGKPVLYAWNVAETHMDDYKTPAPKQGVEHMVVAARLERELGEIEDPEERAMFLEDLGLTESALDKVVSATYRLLGLITYLTAGEKEVRAWPVRKGSTAPEAAAVIHTDFQKGFIRAQILSWDDFLECGNFKVAKDKGVLRREGKEYIVQDGDIIEFFFNV